MDEGWEGLNQGPGKVPIETQQAQYELNKIIATTFKSPNGKKCLDVGGSRQKPA